MKKQKLYNCYLSLAISLGVLMACDQTNDKVSPGSNFDTPTARALDTLDQWIQDHFVTPYNIEVSYRWESSLHDLSKYLNPPTIDSVKPALKAVKQIWIDPYNVVGGGDFIKRIAPRQLVLIGSKNIPPGGSNLATLGVAEQGKRITLFEVDLLKKTPPALRLFLHTIQHEYAHILDQTLPFDEKAWIAISPEGYTSQWYQKTMADSRNLGFISPYARANVSEDFAEMVGWMLTRSKTEWDGLIDHYVIQKIRENENMVDKRKYTIDASGREKIRKKERILVDYYDELGIDLYALQDSIYRAGTRYLNASTN